MSEGKVEKAMVRELPGLIRDFMDKVLDDNGWEWIRAFKLFLKKQNPWPEVLMVMSDLLKGVSCVATKAVELFKPEEWFQKGEHDGVKIAYVSENLQRVMSGKTETNVPEATLRIHQLCKSSVDGPIIAELGGESVVVTTFAQMRQMVMAQGRGQRGKLLTNGYASIFYIKDANGVLWAVYCFCHVDGWYFYASSVTDPYTCRVGFQVVSC